MIGIKKYFDNLTLKSSRGSIFFKSNTDVDLKPFTTYNVEDYPLIWINGLYYNTFKDDTFEVSAVTNKTTQEEYDAVTTINLSNESLTTDFTFLDKFKNLINLLLSDNNINIIDLSIIYDKSLIKNIAIKNNNITTCDLQGFNNVESVLIHTNNISEVDFSDLLSVERLEFYTNNISEVDLSNLSNLDILIGFQNNLTNIDLSNNTLLTELALFSNSITSIDLSNNTLLTICKIQSNELTNIDLSNNTLLTDVRIHNNELDAATNSQVLIDLDSHGQNNGYLQSTIFGGGFITPTGIDSFNALLSKSWSVVGLTNQITSGTTYNIEDFPKIWIDNLYHNTYKGDTFVPNVNTLMTGQAEYDAVTDISLNNKSLTTDFTFLDKFKNLINLLLSDNNINIIDLSKIYNKSLIKNIAIKNNNITTCNLQGFNNVETLLIHTNNISEVDFSDLLSVERLEFYANNISEVDLSNLSNLDILIGFQNNLTNIDLSNNTLLTELTVFSNSIISIDLSNNTLLTICKIQSNKLTNIDLSNNTLLTDVRIHNNELDAETNSQVLIDLDSHGQNNGYLQSTIFGGGTLTAAGQTAKANLQGKGWTIIGI